MVERVKSFWRWLPAWWPVGVGVAYLIYASITWHAQVDMKLDLQENQITEIQQYLREDHKKTTFTDLYPGISSNQQPEYARIGR